MSAQLFLAESARRTEDALKAYLDAQEGVPARLDEAMRYSLFAGGKRLRPALALGAAELISGEVAVAMSAACALEMIHTYSLIHDDLPAMDDDDTRRGKPTCHKVYGESLAILAGDALLTMAFDILGDTGDPRVIQDVARAAGGAGMVGGQVLDLAAEGREISVDELRRIHEHKTGALIRASVRAGAMLAGADSFALASLTAYGEHIGLAFQITDDILDVTGDEAATGKPSGSDEASDKATYPALLGLEQSRAIAQGAVDAAIASLSGFGMEADTFRALAHYVVERSS